LTALWEVRGELGEKGARGVAGKEKGREVDRKGHKTEGWRAMTAIITGRGSGFTPNLGEKDEGKTKGWG